MQAIAVHTVIFDLGGVVLESPRDALARYERDLGLPGGSTGRVMLTSEGANAWAALECGAATVDEFAGSFEAAGRSLGITLEGQAILSAIHTPPRPVMLRALDRLREAGIVTAALTNTAAAPIAREVRSRFDIVVESVVEGVRKPEPEIYRILLDRVACEAQACVFLDDLGVNLKPARALGMTTIRVDDPGVALAELGELLGLELAEGST